MGANNSTPQEAQKKDEEQGAAIHESIVVEEDWVEISRLPHKDYSSVVYEPIYMDKAFDELLVKIEKRMHGQTRWLVDAINARRGVRPMTPVREKGRFDPVAESARIGHLYLPPLWPRDPEWRIKENPREFAAYVHSVCRMWQHSPESRRFYLIRWLEATDPHRNHLRRPCGFPDAPRPEHRTASNMSDSLIERAFEVHAEEEIPGTPTPKRRHPMLPTHNTTEQMLC